VSIVVWACQDAWVKCRRTMRTSGPSPDNLRVPGSPRARRARAPGTAARPQPGRQPRTPRTPRTSRLPRLPRPAAAARPRRCRQAPPLPPGPAAAARPRTPRRVPRPVPRRCDNARKEHNAGNSRWPVFEVPGMSCLVRPGTPGRGRTAVLTGQRACRAVILSFPGPFRAAAAGRGCPGGPHQPRQPRAARRSHPRAAGRESARKLWLPRRIRAAMGYRSFRSGHNFRLLVLLEGRGWRVRARR
jgi:hypothetical protein